MKISKMLWKALKTFTVLLMLALFVYIVTNIPLSLPLIPKLMLTMFVNAVLDILEISKVVQPVAVISFVFLHV